jgi:hypothetical protein
MTKSVDMCSIWRTKIGEKWNVHQMCINGKEMYSFGIILRWRREATKIEFALKGLTEKWVCKKEIKRCIYT